MFSQYCPESQTLKQKLASANVPQNSRKKFLYKLFNLLEENSCPHIISWSDDGQKVMLKNSFLLTEQILSTLFSHCNYSSFIRQFHFYQFKRVICDAQSIQAYQHPHFQRGKPDLLVLVQRVTKADKNDKKEVKTEFSEHRSEIERLEMEKAHNDLRQKTLSEELQRALEAIEMLKSQNMLLKDKIQNDQRYLERATSQVNFVSKEEALFYPTVPTFDLQVSIKKADNISEPTFITYSGSYNPDSSAITLTSEATPSEETESEENFNQMADTIAYLPPLPEWKRSCSIQNDYNLQEKHEELELEIGLSLCRPISFGKWNSNFFLGL